MTYPMQRQAGELASRGRHGDSLLVHMNPEEVSGIAALMPGKMTINPYTGQPEMFNFKDLVPYLATGIAWATGMGPVATALTTGLSTAAVEGDLKRGLAAGIMSFGLGKALGGAGKAGMEAIAKEGVSGSLAKGAGSELWRDATMGQRLGATFGNEAGRKALMSGLSSPGSFLPISIGAGNMAEMDARDAWEKQAASLDADSERKRKEYYDEWYRAVTAGYPTQMAEGGQVSPWNSLQVKDMNEEEVAIFLKTFDETGSQDEARKAVFMLRKQMPQEEKGLGALAKQRVRKIDEAADGMAMGGMTNMYDPYTRYMQGQDGDTPRVNPASIQSGLRGRMSVPPPFGFVPGFNPEFSYFQNVPGGGQPSAPPFVSPQMSSNQLYNPEINRFVLGAPPPQNQPYFRSIFEDIDEITSPFEPQGMAGGGTVSINTDFGPMTMQAGGIANLAAQQQPQQGPGQEHIQMLAMALTGQIPEDQAGPIIQGFIEAYGVDVFRQIREAILGSGTQNEGMVEGPGGGMDDQVMGSIGNQQPVAVSPGEYIVPADVVSGLGDGSSDSGAGVLDEMSTRVRTARTGGQMQPPKLDKRTVLPA